MASVCGWERVRGDRGNGSRGVSAIVHPLLEQCAVEQHQLAGLIIRRSVVKIHPALPAGSGVATAPEW